MKTIVITGGAGSIGLHLAEALVRKGVRVVVVDSFDGTLYDPRIKRANVRAVLSSLGEGERARFHVIERDVLDVSVDDLPIREADAVVHLAALAGVRPSIEAPRRWLETNVIGTQAALDLARALGARRSVLASSSSVYGVCPDVPWREDARLVPISPYAASKLAAEHACAVASRLWGMSCVALRFFTVYGPRQRPDLFIAKAMEAAYAGTPLTLFGDGRSERDYTYVSDIVEGILAALDADIKGFEAVNLGSDRPVPLLDLVRAIEEATGRRIDVRHAPAQPGDVPRTWADLSKARALLGWAPRVPLAEGLSRQAEQHEATI